MPTIAKSYPINKLVIASLSGVNSKQLLYLRYIYVELIALR